MTRGSVLGQIPVHIEHRDTASETGTIGGGVAAILTEIASLLERVAASGDSAAIDLRSLPMSPSDRQSLEEALGRGEVEIVLHADGESRIRETGVQGVWWTEYRDRNGAVIAAFIEIARVPGILIVPPEELTRGAVRLRDTARSAATPQRESFHVTT
jgi:hypothetical protein